MEFIAFLSRKTQPKERNALINQKEPILRKSQKVI